MNSFQRQLAAWGFRPIDPDGQPKSDQPQQPQAQPEKQLDDATRDLAKKILNMPDMKL